MHYDCFTAPAVTFQRIDGQGMIVNRDAPIDDPGEDEEDEDDD